MTGSIVRAAARTRQGRIDMAQAERLRRAALRVIACATVAFLSLAGTAAADWPVYGHDLGNSRSAGADGPTAAEAATLQRAWTFNSPNGDFTGTPVVAGGTLVAGTNL